MATDEYIQKFFSFRGRTRNLPFYPRRGKREDLAKLMASIEFNLGAEIGVGEGLYSRVLLDANHSLHLKCIDPWMAYNGKSHTRINMWYDEAMKNLNGRNVEVIRKVSLHAVKDFEHRTFDFVYIDGNHKFDFVILDIIYWMPKVKKGGIFALHDYHNRVGIDVITAVDSYTRAHFINPWYVTREMDPTAFWVVK